MKLTDLEPQFIRYEESLATIHMGRPLPDGTTQWGGFPVKSMRYVETLAEAQGVMFICPKCFRDNGMIGTHSVQVTFAGRGVADEDGVHNTAGEPVRWAVSGSGYADLTATPSVDVQVGCRWHGFISSGEVSII